MTSRARSTLFGDVEVTFTRDPLSNDIHYRATGRFGWFDFFVNGRLSVGGEAMGLPVTARLGRFSRCCSKHTSELMDQQFRGIEWHGRDNLRVECDSGECVIIVKKKLRLR